MSPIRSFVFRSAAHLAVGSLLSGASAMAFAQQTQTAAAPVPPAFQYGQARPLEVDRGASAVWQDLQKLKTRASLVMIVAHPDDEDGPMLTYESRQMGVDTSLLTLTRGEGGQNIMSSELWDGLGLVRTEELLAAGNYYGVHQYFTRVADYGFSKTLEEAMRQWGHDRVLRDVVRVVRLTRPLVVTSVFVGGVSDGHGHHQTSGEMAQEVYNAAGDKKVFPDQIAEGLLPWTPLKVYARAPFARVTPQGIFDYATNRYSPVEFHDYVNGTTIKGLPPTTVEIHEGKVNPLLGGSPAQVAREGLGQQKSQNGGVPVPFPGPSDSQYHLYASRVDGKLPEHENSFFDGVDTSLTAIASFAPKAQQGAWRERFAAIQSSVEHAASAFDGTNPSRSAPALAEGLKQTEEALRALASSGLPDDAKYNMQHELTVKRDQFNQALNDALGIYVLAMASGNTPPQGATGGPGAGGGESGGPSRDTSFQSVIPGESFRVAVQIADQGTEPVTVTNSKLVSHAGEGWTLTAEGKDVGAVEAGAAAIKNFAVTVPANAELTKPYFARKSVEQSFYDILDPRYMSLPTGPYPLSAEVGYTYHGVEGHVSAVVQAMHRYVGPGPVPEPLLVAPAVSLTVSPTAGVVPMANASLHVQVTVHSSAKDKAEGTVKLDLPPGWTSEPASAPFSTTLYNEERALSFTVTPKNVQSKPYTITAVADFEGKTYKQGFQTVGYPPLRPYPLYRDATYQVTGVDLKIAPDLKIAYIMGSGDDVPQSLQDIGIHVTMLSAQDLSTADLSVYDAVLLGIRTYSARPELVRANQRLLTYAKNGGVVIVQYQSSEFASAYAPYPFTLGGNGDRVVEEDNKVAILAPNDPVLNYPNHITVKDFDGWIEERGHGFPASWAAEYTALTETRDSGQDPQKGGILYTRYGKGAWVYTAFAFFRQMPEGVPGSYRVMANLLSIGKNPAMRGAQ